MFHLIMAIVTSVCISLIMRLSGARVKNTMGMLLIGYLTATLLSALHTGFDNLLPSHPQMPKVLAMSAVNGMLYASGLVLMQLSIPRNGVVATSTYTRLSLVVTIVFSLVLFREVPTGLQVLGLFLAVGAIALSSIQKGSARFNPLLLAILLLGGTIDIWVKVFSTWGEPSLSDQFLFGTFLCAALICFGLMLYKKQRLSRWELLFGTMIAIPNYYNSRFLLKSLEGLPSIIVYPTFNVGTLLLLTVIGVGVFREKLSKRQWIALAIILLALTLLNL